MADPMMVNLTELGIVIPEITAGQREWRGLMDAWVERYLSERSISNVDMRAGAEGFARSIADEMARMEAPE